MSLDNPALIIGGQPKAGTSSLFHWLSQHPDTAPSRVKEVRFFLDKGYPLPSGARYNGKNADQYLKFFGKAPGEKTLLDASPDYLYSDNALNIPDVLPNARIVFILRDPVERIVSWYKFCAQIGRLDRNMTFDDFIRYQLENEVTDTTPIHLRGLEHNRVGKYLPPFQKRFGDRCLVVDFADMKRAPQDFVQNVCRFAGLDPDFFDGFDFMAQNVSESERASRLSRVYFESRAAFNYWLNPSEKTLSLLRPAARRIKRVLSRSEPLEHISIATDIEIKIKEGSAISAKGQTR
mgnify:CR=1 FL=1